jgi:holo-[acyl-carrier protein] synthase
MLGVDLVDVDRLQRLLERSPALESRLFSEAERDYCHSKPRPARHFAGTLAAKEAVIKAVRLGPLVAWARRIEISRDASGEPSAAIDGHRAALSISISHDGGMAVAVAMVQAGDESLLVMHGVTSELVPKRGDQFPGEQLLLPGSEPSEQSESQSGHGNRLVDGDPESPSALSGVIDIVGDPI